jgi:hypothetical protein
LKFTDIPLSELTVNPKNDRHGPQSSEQDAITWLFTHHESHMLRLAADILEQGEIFDSPLVKQVGQEYIVYDGNRRVTCLKALERPSIAPPSIGRKLNAMLSKKVWTPLDAITCQLETNQAKIDQIVGRRHNGIDGGRGQAKWDTRAQELHANRIGTKTSYPTAEAVEAFLKEEGVPFANDINRSTLERLLKAKKRQKDFGFTIANGKIALSAPKDEVLPALIKVAEDIVDGKLTLSNLLRASETDKYIDGLKHSQILPASITPVPKAPLTARKDQSKKKPATKPKERSNLIPATTENINFPENRTKILLIWNELRTTLKFGRQDIAIAVMLRVLIDVVTEHARDHRGIKKKKTLAQDIVSIANELASLDLLSTQEVKDIDRFCHDERTNRGLVCLQRNVHSSTISLHPNDLRLMWDQMETYIIQAIEIPRD